LEVSSILSQHGWATVSSGARYIGWLMTAFGLMITIIGYYADSTAKRLKEDREALYGRVLDGQQAATLASQMKPFAGKKYWVMIQTNNYDRDAEQMRFGEQLDQIFQKAGWVKEQYSQIDQQGTKCPLALYERASSRGLQVAGHSDPASQKLADDVRKILKAASIPSEPRLYDDVIPDFLLITVALR
jgi:hypothetical protein